MTSPLCRSNSIPLRPRPGLGAVEAAFPSVRHGLPVGQSRLIAPEAERERIEPFPLALW